MPEINIPAPNRNAMIRQYRFVAYQAVRRLPDPAQTVSGMMRIIPAITANVLMKVSIPV